MEQNPLEGILRSQEFLVLDGGLATELEARGYDLSDNLWSARLLYAHPDVIADVHTEYLKAGADCIISASYQATVAGLMTHGLREDEAKQTLRRATELAVSARDRFWLRAEQDNPDRQKPLVAASIGPYGAYLADGSEYTGRYNRNEAELVAFHRRRWDLLSESGVDLLACETIPSAVEAHALARLLAEPGPVPAWVSFSCRDEDHISDGTPLVDAVRPLLDLPRVIALGINCTPPRFLPRLLETLHGTTDKPLVAYPNSGETYDPVGRCWQGQSDPDDFGKQAVTWYTAGARLVGGCCRTRPAHVAQIRLALKRMAAIRRQP